MILITFIWLLYILVDAITSWYIIVKKNISPDHTMLTVIRSIVAILWGGFALDAQPGEFLPFALFTGGSFWVLFDLLLNIFRGKGILYRGQTSEIDKASNTIPMWLYVCFKLLAIAGAIWGWEFLAATR